MPVGQIEILPKPHPSQQRILNHPARFKVLVCGRRWGKTVLGVCACVLTAAKGGRTWWVAPTFPIAQEGWRMSLRVCRDLPGVQILESERLINFPGGGSLQVKSTSHPESLRGVGLDGLVLDEAAFVNEDAWTEALRPTLTDRRGWAIFISTPHGPNWFKELYEFAHTAESWATWQLPTSDNPHIDAAEIALAKAQSHPATFAQ